MDHSIERQYTPQMAKVSSLFAVEGIKILGNLVSNYA